MLEFYWIHILFNDLLSNAMIYIWRVTGVENVKDEFRRSQQETDVLYFTVLSQDIPQATAENHASIKLACGMRKTTIN